MTKAALHVARPPGRSRQNNNAPLLTVAAEGNESLSILSAT
jgi:hypothetical protein